MVGLAQQSGFEKIKPIHSLLDNQPSLSGPILQLTQHMSEYYGCSWGEAIETSLPNALRKPKIVEYSSPCAAKPTADTRQETIFFHDPGGRERWPYFQEKIREVSERGKGAMILVPEISMIDAALAELRKVVQTPVVILDKNQSQKELEQWQRIKEGKITFVIGTRSRGFAPVCNLGLIIVFEEENPAYKQEQSPFYHARDIVRMRSGIEKCSVLFISAVFRGDLARGQDSTINKIFHMPKNLSGMQLIDLSNYNPAKSSVVSFPLRNIMEKSVAQKERVLLFLNRKGFSTVTRCNNAAGRWCARAVMNLTYLYSKKKMVCRMCRYTTEVPKICPQCKSSYCALLGRG